jgi:uncharacterized protein YraI
MRTISVIVLLVLATLNLACRPTPVGTPTPVSTQPVVSDSGTIKPQVVIASPVDGQEFEAGQAIDIQTGSLDEHGIARVELLVDEQVVDVREVAPVPEAVLATNFAWTPTRSGRFTLRVRAFDPVNDITQSEPVTIRIGPALAAAITPESPVATPTTVPLISITPLPTETETPTPSPVPPTATPTTASAYLVVKAQSGLNVRAGPSTSYRVIGQLDADDQVEILGQGNVGAGRWWQIDYPLAQSNTGWVSASADFATSFNTDEVPLVAVPPTPIPTPATNTPTPTPVAQQARIDFGTDRTQIQAGECVTFFWNVTNVKEVYFNGVGVAGESQARRECPGVTETYELRVVTDNGATESKTIQIIVAGSANRRITMDEGESVDFDRDGRVSDDGDDFKWVEDGNDREFRKWDGDDDLKLIPVGPIDSLNTIRRQDCEWALDNLNDDNAIHPFPGLAVCFRTDEGRLGKLRFENDDEEIDIEWLVW